MPQFRRGLVGCLLVLLSLGAAVNLEAKTWKVDSTMTRMAIQAVIDGAADNDTIRFTAGTYDFSATPFSTKPWSGGALVVTDKSLKFTADKGVILLGADSVLDPVSGIGTSGIIAFNVMNSATKDISFKGFTFRKFLFGIISGIEVLYDPAHNNEVLAPSCRDFTVQNCTFQFIDRAAVDPTGVQRNIKILNNKIIWSLRFGMYIDWYWVGDHSGTQPKTGKITMTNNEIHARIIGVLIQNGYNMSIKNNTFDATGSDFAGSEGLYISGGANAPSIVNNKVTNFSYGFDLEDWDFKSGSTVYSYPFTKGNITNNKIKAYDGIWLGGNAFHGNKFTNNTVTVDNTIIAKSDALPWGFSAGGSYDDTFTNNKILGSGIVAFDVEGWDYTGSGGDKASAHNEIFKKNSVKGFVVYAMGVDYYMNPYTHDNTAIGICPEKATYYDEGVNNIFKCIFLQGSGAANLKNGFTLSTRNHFDRTPLER